MSVFTDKKFDELDWISQATEPIDSQMNDILATIPDTTVIDFDLFKRSTSSYYIDVTIGKVLTLLLSYMSPSRTVSSNQLYALEKCFQFEISGEDLILNFENKTITGGEIRLIKTCSTMDEKVLANMLGHEGIDILAYSSFPPNNEALSRANEIIEILGKCEDGLKTRSEHRKRRVICGRLKTLFKENEWNIRDTELANKVGKWIKDYIVDGNLAALSNFCRLKVMTHKGQPIYSMEEVV